MFFRKVKQNSTTEHNLCKTILIGGEAGQGVKSAGKLAAYAMLYKGFDVHLYDEYPSLIRGGHNDVFITFSEYPVYSPNREIDIMICIDKTTFDKWGKYLKPKSVVFYNPSDFDLSGINLTNFPCEFFPVDINKIINRNDISPATKNTLYLCIGLMAIGVDKSTVKQALQKLFSNKPEKLEINIKACDVIYDEYQEIFGIAQVSLPSSIPEKTGTKLFLSGNEAVGIGAIESKIGFYAAYPMTPASSLLDFMFKHFKKYNFAVKQTEDEIAAINMAIGASYAGARAMVGTSGGGFSLMVEGLGLAAITETPIVIFLSQRPGPATGMPTWHSQSDLHFVLNASQDEFPRVVLTPTDHEEMRSLTFLAFNIAEKFQVPVFILADKYLSESYATIDYHPNQQKIHRGLVLNEVLLERIENFKRYEFTKSGISPRSIPGQRNGTYLANSDESNEKGYSTDDPEIRKMKMEKRSKKMERIFKELPELNVYGDPKAKTCIITWGSTKGPVLEAIRRLQNNKKGSSLKLIALNYVEPFPIEQIKSALGKVSDVIVAECNFSGQLFNMLNNRINTRKIRKFCKYDGRPFFPDEIEQFICEIV